MAPGALPGGPTDAPRHDGNAARDRLHRNAGSARNARNADNARNAERAKAAAPQQHRGLHVATRAPRARRRYFHQPSC
jgi:hypothetical protein